MLEAIYIAYPKSGVFHGGGVITGRVNVGGGQRSVVHGYLLNHVSGRPMVEKILLTGNSAKLGLGVAQGAEEIPDPLRRHW